MIYTKTKTKFYVNQRNSEIVVTAAVSFSALDDPPEPGIYLHWYKQEVKQRQHHNDIITLHWHCKYYYYYKLQVQQTKINQTRTIFYGY